MTLRPQSTDTLDSPSHSELHQVQLNVKAYGAVGDGTTDDTTAITDTITAAADGGSVYFPPGDYKVTSTIDLSDLTSLHFVGGHGGTESAVGSYPPQVAIDGRTITTGAVFYCDQGGNSAGHTYENLSILGGRTAVHYFDTGNLWFTNCSMSCANTGHADNTSLLLENVFWVWIAGRGGYGGPAGTDDNAAIIFRGRTGYVNAAAPGIIQVEGITIWNGNFEYQNNNNATTSGTFSFTNVLTENASVPFFKITQGGTTTDSWILGNFYFRHCFLADPTVADLPFIELDAVDLLFGGVVIEQCAPAGASFAAIKATNALQVTGVHIIGLQNVLGELGTRIVTDGSGNLFGSSVSDKKCGFDIVADQWDKLTVTDNDIISNAKGAAIRMAQHGDTKARFGLDHTGVHYWGSGTAAYDTTLYRSAADVLATDDTLEFVEHADASAGAANSARLYARDNGAGKTQLVVRFASGAVQVLATEP